MHEWCYRERWLTACSSGKTLQQQLWSTGAFESTSAYLKLTKLLVLSQQIKFPFGFLRIILLTANNVLFLWYVVLTPFSCQRPIAWFEKICFAWFEDRILKKLCLYTYLVLHVSVLAYKTETVIRWEMRANSEVWYKLQFKGYSGCFFRGKCVDLRMNEIS